MRLLLLMPTHTYRADDFLAAADRLGVEVVLGSDRCHKLEELGLVRTTRDSLVLDFLDPEASSRTIAGFAEAKRLDGVIAADDETTVIAALASEKLGLRHNPPAAARASRDKLRLRERLAAGGVRQPRFRDLPLGADPREAAREAARDPGFPCVLKPRFLSASRGVIRADDERSFAEAFARVARIVSDPETRAHGGEAAASLLVESFVPGGEVAVEGVLAGGELTVLALFDKPDPLDGPFFEETIYVTPSRLAPETQTAIRAETAKAAKALGLAEGPVHAELRIDERGGSRPASGRDRDPRESIAAIADAPHVLEIAARSIGGLCSRTLRFGAGMSLEEVLIRHALSGKLELAPRELAAAGVMMLPIPVSGVFRGVDGIDDAKAVGGIEEITITALPGRDLQALPEGSSYLGFVIARAAGPAEVESALREAHRRLTVRIASSLKTV
jgi:biotin carboxylase